MQSYYPDGFMMSFIVDSVTIKHYFCVYKFHAFLAKHVQAFRQIVHKNSSQQLVLSFSPFLTYCLAKFAETVLKLS